MRNFTTMARQLMVCWVVFLGLGYGVGFGQELDWKWQNPLPTGNPLNDVHVFNSHRILAVGEAGVILISPDGGQTWQAKVSGTTLDLLSVYFVDNLTGWTVGVNGTILKTVNGGETWVKQHETSWPNYNLYSVYFIDDQHGWASGSQGARVFTQNGGQTWTGLQSQFSINYRCIYFFDQLHGIAAGDDGELIRTDNGGWAWFDISNSFTDDFYDIQFIDNQIGWIAGMQTVGCCDTRGKILKTTDGGQTWQPTLLPTKGLTSIHFISSSTGWAISSRGEIVKTMDGGQTWETQASPTPTCLLGLHFSDSQNGIAVGYNGVIVKTGNGGLVWSKLSYNCLNDSYQDLQSVFFVNSSIGYAAGKKGSILKTTNKGRTWDTLNSGTNNDLYSVHFISSTTGWVVGGYGTLLKTTDGGQSWHLKSTGNPNYLFKVLFLDSLNGWIAGSRAAPTLGGNIMKTTDGGETWQFLDCGVTEMMHGLQFTDMQHGFIAGDNGKILKTEDGGQTWSLLYSITGQYIYSICFVDSLRGWVVGNYGFILRTVNGGVTWQHQTGVTNAGLNSVFFIDTLNGWICGDNGAIQRTRNGGNTWQRLKGGTYKHFSSVFFSDSITGWMVGEAATILTTTTNHYQPPKNPAVVSGRLYEKSSSSCDFSSIPVPGLVVKASPGPYYAISNSEGNFKLKIPVLDTVSHYSVRGINYSNPIYQAAVVCPPSETYPVVIDTVPDTLGGIDFGYAVTVCHHLSVQMASNRRRPCIRNMTTVSYVNQGSTSAPDAYILVEFPHWVRPISATVSHIALNDSTWRFNLDTISAGESGSFTIIDSVLCGHPEIRNLNQCTKATIYPAPDCLSPSWSGAEISAEGLCDNGWVQFFIRNKTSHAMVDSVDYWMYLDSIQVRTGKVKLAANDSVSFWVEAGGLTAHLTVNQVANHPTEVFVSATIEACSDTTFIPRQVANRFPKDQSPNSKTHCLPIRDSYDPNDKQAFPIGFTSSHVVKPGTEMEYLVRFQNTGNDTAFTVYVIDSLDNNLNVESLEIGAVSHPYELTLQTTRQGRNFLRFQFNNIMLPDSNTNELKSHGFIQYRIKPKDGIPLGTQARNEAEIYFDFNPPVYTNTTVTTFDNLVFTDTSLNGNVYSQEPVAPTLNTTLLSGVTLTSAVSGGTITNDGGPDVTVRGVVWDTAHNPTIALSTKTEDGSGTGSFTSNLTNLQPSTTYYLRAYATNAVGTAYGEERQFTTLSPATLASVITGSITTITTTSASTSNEITNDGGAPVTARGVVWDANPSPTISLPTKTVDGADTGTFTSNLSNLQPGTQYYVRAYATNTVGTSYGEERQFTTLLIGVNPMERGREVTVSPNPFGSRLFLKAEVGREISISIQDILGKEWLSTRFTGSKELELGHLPSGIYLLHFPELNRVLKVVKE